MATEQEKKLSRYFHKGRFRITDFVDWDTVHRSYLAHEKEIRQLSIWPTRITPEEVALLGNCMGGSHAPLEWIKLENTGYNDDEDINRKVDVVLQGLMQGRWPKMEVLCLMCRPLIEVMSELIASDFFDHVQSFYLIASPTGFLRVKKSLDTLEHIPNHNFSATTLAGKFCFGSPACCVQIECSHEHLFTLARGLRGHLTEMEVQLKDATLGREETATLAVHQATALLDHFPDVTSVRFGGQFPWANHVKLAPLIGSLARHGSIKKAVVGRGSIEWSSDEELPGNTQLVDLTLDLVTFRWTEPLSCFRGLESLTICHGQFRGEQHWEPVLSLASLKSLTIQNKFRWPCECILSALAAAVGNGKRFDRLELDTNLHADLWAAISANSENIKSLCMEGMSDEERRTVLRGLGDMDGPVTLSLGRITVCSTLLLTALQHNTGIQFIMDLDLHEDDSRRRDLSFWLLRNRCQALSASGTMTNPGLWANIFGHALDGNCPEYSPTLVYDQLRTISELVRRRGIQRERNEDSNQTPVETDGQSPDGAGRP